MRKTFLNYSNLQVLFHEFSTSTFICVLPEIFSAPVNMCRYVSVIYLPIIYYPTTCTKL